MKDVLAFEYSDYLALDKSFDADRTIFVSFANFHFFDICEFYAHPKELFLQIILL